MTAHPIYWSVATVSGDIRSTYTAQPTNNPASQRSTVRAGTLHETNGTCKLN